MHVVQEVHGLTTVSMPTSMSDVQAYMTHIAIMQFVFLSLHLEVSSQSPS